MKDLIKKIIPLPLLNFYHYCLALAGAFLYGFPGKNKGIKIIGVTGTSGKSTTVGLISLILEQAGFNVASISSVRFKIKGKEWENKLKMTMPGRIKIQKFLNAAIKEKCQFVVLEATSEGIRQNRHKFINFDAAVFTNLSPEHVESHGGFENYRNEKLKLFKVARNIHIINIDDENAQYFWKMPAKEKIGYSIKNLKSQVISAQNIRTSNNGLSFVVENAEFNLNLLGEFNIYNALAAVCVGTVYGINMETCKKALERAKGIPGRMEIVARKPFTVVVDYAHTPVQLESVYKTLKKNNQGEKLICVLGSCGGGRDKWKRPVLGKLALEYCREIIITNEDPYDEDPMEIINQVASGAEGRAKKILDRKEAIKKAIDSARGGDTIIVTGKGSEPWMCVKRGKKIPWDDREIVKEEIKNIL
jgi:UDP-N-acetylmuramoyl-L-alanyl-D-glutamate--2,6-diaminopimelate ligase